MTTTVTPLCATADSEMLHPFGHNSRMFFQENSILYIKRCFNIKKKEIIRDIMLYAFLGDQKAIEELTREDFPYISLFTLI